MAIRCLGAAIGLAALVAGTGSVAATAAQNVKTANTTLVDAEGKSIGKVMLSQARDGVLVKASITGLKTGSYGFHLHTTGKCDAPDFKTAGGHWNPAGHQHGKDNAQGPHMGDMLNIDVAASGMGALEQKIPSAMLTGGDHPLLDEDGASAMLHAGPDDYKTDPAGNSGARIACGIIAAGK